MAKDYESQLPDCAQAFRDADRYFARPQVRNPRIHKRDMEHWEYPLCGEDFSADHKDGVDRGFLLGRTTKQWSKVDCRACLALMPPEVKQDIEREAAALKIRSEREYAAYAVKRDTVDRIHKAVPSIPGFRCLAAFDKIGDEARTIAWLTGIAERERIAKAAKRAAAKESHA